MRTRLLWILAIFFIWRQSPAQDLIRLENEQVKIQWEKANKGYNIRSLSFKSAGQWIDVGQVSGEYTYLYSQEEPAEKAKETLFTAHGDPFPGKEYKYLLAKWDERTRDVALNTAGEAVHFYPDKATQVSDQKILFEKQTPAAHIQTVWELVPEHPQDILITQTVDLKQAGYYSFASPTLAVVSVDELEWATVPGYFHGNYIGDDFTVGYAYGNGIPGRPIVFSETTASTLSPIIASRQGFTAAVLADPVLGRDSWEKDKMTHEAWRLGLSHMNSKGELSPTLYYPVLGQPLSQMAKGDQISFSFRFSLHDKDWFETLKHAVYDIHDFEESLKLRRNEQSLSNRVETMHGYLTDPTTSLWRVEEFEGKQIGAQAYLGGVVGSDKDAMKNADYGAMWMLAHATADPQLKNDILPYALNFKLAQQQVDEGFFKGAAMGQYYLSKSRKFVEEWGDMVEPIALTYYIMLDMGNILLFEKDNNELKDRLRLGADLLMAWQKPDGSWPVAFDREGKELFPELKDYRATFYGLLVAYRLLREEKYLDAAIKGADWYLENGINKGCFLGVCGDVRYVPDFATAQTAQAYLDLYDITRAEKYKVAAIQAAEIYTTHIYTHPISTTESKTVKDKQLQDWEISQAGLSFEHGGAIGSANSHGPILLASHAGMFIRMYGLTGERIFADMARSAAIGRHAFVNDETGVASYYWRNMDAGSGPFPHHAWWQIGWITDYLMAEAELRSAGKIQFPRGFITPKVGPHQSYGFEPGAVYGEKARLKIFPEGLVVDNPSLEHIVTETVDGKQMMIVLLNQHTEQQAGTVMLELSKLKLGKSPSAVRILNQEGKVLQTIPVDQDWKVSVPPYGLCVLQLVFE
jgi:hypothetical protein